MSRVGENIKDARLKKGISQRQLGKKLGVSEGFIGEVETGRRIANEKVLNRISKVLGEEFNDINMYVEDSPKEEVKATYEDKILKKEKPKEINEVWSEAFGSVLKSVPVYGYYSSEIITTRQLPIIDNKIEGYSQDKVLFIRIEDNNMIGFRIAKGDIAFGHLTQQVDNNSIFLIEYKGLRVIRQIKKLDGNKILLVSNEGTVKTETVSIRDINVLMKLDKLEIKL